MIYRTGSLSCVSQGFESTAVTPMIVSRSYDVQTNAMRQRTAFQPPQPEFDAEAALAEACRILRAMDRLESVSMKTRAWFVGYQARENDEIDALVSEAQRRK